MTRMSSARYLHIGRLAVYYQTLSLQPDTQESRLWGGFFAFGYGGRI